MICEKCVNYVFVTKTIGGRVSCELRYCEILRYYFASNEVMDDCNRFETWVKVG